MIKDQVPSLEKNLQLYSSNNLSTKQTKKCFVLLERLDDKLLNLYLREENADDRIYCNYRKWKKRKNSEDWIAENEFRRRKKKKIPSLCYTDDEDNSTGEENFSNKRETVNEDKGKTELFAFARYRDSIKETNSLHILQKCSDDLKSKCSNCDDLKESLNNKNNLTIDFPSQQESKISDIEKRRSETTLKSILQTPYNVPNNTESSKILPDTADTNQKIKNTQKPRNPHEKVDTTLSNGGQYGGEEQIFVENYLGQKEFEDEEEYDSRDENEDDKSTIIFEKIPQRDADLEDIFDIDETEVELACDKFNNSEMTNQKIPKPEKFRKKSATGKNLTKITKPKSEPKNAFRREADEKTAAGCEGIKAICDLVKKLHELHRIILQLQIELPKNKFCFHFSTMITTQQANFYKEIKKSQKTVIKYYKEMLLWYGNAHKVTLEISKLTSLNVENVANVISRCFFADGTYELEECINKATRETKMHEVLQLPKAYNSDFLYEQFQGNSIQKKSREEDFLPPSSDPCLFSRNNNSDLVRCLIQPPPGRDNSLAHDQNTSRHTIRNSSAICDDFRKERIERVNRESHAWMQQPKFHAQKNPEREQLLCLGQCSLCPAVEPSRSQKACMQTSNTSAQYCGPVFPSQSVWPEASYPQDATFSLFQTGSLLSAPNRCGVLPFPVKNNSSLYNDVREKSTAERLSQGCTKTSSVGSKSLYGPCGDQRKTRTSPSKAQGLLKFVPEDPCRLPDSKFPKGSRSPNEDTAKRSCGIQTNSAAELENSLVRARGEIFDPKIPQKLTMKNSRLQAGCILSPESKGGASEVTGEQLNPGLPVKKNSSCNKTENSRKNFKSRTYICAQNGCRKSGVRICRGCQSIIYCSRTCQMNHWTLKHNAECYQLRKLREGKKI